MIVFAALGRQVDEVGVGVGDGNAESLRTTSVAELSDVLLPDRDAGPDQLTHQLTTHVAGGAADQNHDCSLLSPTEGANSFPRSPTPDSRAPLRSTVMQPPPK